MELIVLGAREFEGLGTVRPHVVAGQGESSDEARSRGSDVASLVRAAAAGTQSAWDELVERFSRLVWSVTRSYGLDHASASDVVQGTWLRLLENVGRIRQPERLAGWLATTARNETLRLLRQQSRVRPVEDERLGGSDRHEGEPGADSDLLDRGRDMEVRRAMAQLPPRSQLLLRLLTADPRPSYEEIAETMGMPIGSIGPTRARCLAQLKRVLEDQVGGREELVELAS